jgi:hypothetical protein
MKKIGIAATVMFTALLVLVRLIPMSTALQPISLVAAGAAVYFGLIMAMDKGIRGSFLRIFEIDWNP